MVLTRLVRNSSILLMFACASLAFGQEGLQWTQFNGNFPSTTVFGGQENGQKLAVCRCNYNGGTHSGKVVGGNCNIGWGGKEIVIPTFEILLNNGAQLNWVSLSGSLPSNAVIAGYENGHPIYVGKGNYLGGVHPGKIFWSGSRYICNIGYGGKEITINDFKILTASAGQYQAPATAQNNQAVPSPANVSGCAFAIDHWKWFTGDFISLKEDGSIKQFKGVELGKWQCLDVSLRKIKLVWNNGYTDIVSVSSDLNSMNGLNNQNQAVSGIKMSKAEKDALKMQEQVGDALNKIFKKN